MEPKKGTASTGQDDDGLLQKVQAAQMQDSRAAELEKKVAELTEQLKKHSEAASRAQAELANAKMRMEKEAAEMRTFASEVTLKKLLPTVDNLQRALKHLPKDIAENDWVKGIVALEQGFLKQVGDLGLSRFESMGKPVDAERHEVLMQGPGPANTVTEVLEEGYELHGKVIRPAKVKAGDGSEA